MSWNYRVMRWHDDVFDEDVLAIHEVYYKEDNDDHPRSYTLKPVAVTGATAGELSWVLDKMRAALDKPMLTEVDFPDAEVSNDAEAE